MPAELLTAAKPHTKFVLDVSADLIVLRPADEPEPMWMNPDPAKRAEEFLKYADLPRPPAPDIPLNSLTASTSTTDGEIPHLTKSRQTKSNYVIPEVA